MSEPNKPPFLPSTLLTFLALYLTTLFSLDTWAAARDSAWRGPGSTTTTYYRPAATRPNANTPARFGGGARGAGGRRGPGGAGEGRIHSVDSRPPIRAPIASSCGMCG